MKFIQKLIQQETVLCAAFVLAVISALIVPPDKTYLTYIDWNTLLLLFGLMAVMAGFQKLGVFKEIGIKLLSRTRTTRQLMIVLVFLPFFFSMLITNDVALITFVPFAVIVLRLSQQEKRIVPLVVLQTLAANLGSMLTPMGNPQNLYLYAKSGIILQAFLQLMLPYTIASGLCLLAGIFFMKKEALCALDLNTAAFSDDTKTPKGTASKLLCFGIGFLLCLLCVAKLLAPAVAAAVLFFYLLATDRALLKKIDYSLLGTFVCFFVYRQYGTHRALLRAAGTSAHRARAHCGSPFQPDHQQCPCGAAPLRFYRRVFIAHCRHQPRRTWHADCLHGKPYLLQTGSP